MLNKFGFLLEYEGGTTEAISPLRHCEEPYSSGRRGNPITIKEKDCHAPLHSACNDEYPRRYCEKNEEAI